MKLETADRLILLSLIPAEGNIITLKLFRELREALSFNDEENKALNFKQNDNIVTWDQTVPMEKEITIGEAMTDMIKDLLHKMDEEKKLTESHISLYDKFIN